VCGGFDRNLVMARSESDEAIQIASLAKFLDCFADARNDGGIVIPGRDEVASYDVQLHIGESMEPHLLPGEMDSQVRNCAP
jgi:hypothetical protein